MAQQHWWEILGLGSDKPGARRDTVVWLGSVHLTTTADDERHMVMICNHSFYAFRNAKGTAKRLQCKRSTSSYRQGYGFLGIYFSELHESPVKESLRVEVVGGSNCDFLHPIMDGQVFNPFSDIDLQRL